jgi:hypothetical protein
MVMKMKKSILVKNPEKLEGIDFSEFDEVKVVFPDYEITIEREGKDEDLILEVKKVVKREFEKAKEHQAL